MGDTLNQYLRFCLKAIFKPTFLVLITYGTPQSARKVAFANTPICELFLREFTFRFTLHPDDKREATVVMK